MLEGMKAKMSLVLWRSTFFVVLLHLGLCNCSSWDEPHPHQGVLTTPFYVGDPKVHLDSKAESILLLGKPYQTEIRSGTSSGRSLLVQDISTPTSIVWDRILDYNNYAKMVPNTQESKIYKLEKHRNNGQTIFTRMKVGFSILRMEVFVKHNYEPSKKSLTWSLDYTKKSGLDDSCGYWYVVPHPNDNNWTRVYHSAQISTFRWVPKFVVDAMSSKALMDATAWVKKFSELEYTKIELQQQRAESTKRRRSKNWFRRKRREHVSQNDEDSGDASTATCAGTSSEGDCILTTGLLEESPVGITRVALLASTFALSMFNIHIYFSA